MKLYEKLIAISLFVVFLGASNALAQSKLKGNDARLYDYALELAEGTDNANAIPILKKLYEKYNENIDIAYNLGICYMNMSGNPDSALYYFNIVKRLDTGDWNDSRSELYLAIARTYQMKYMYDEALKTYKTVERHDKDSVLLQEIKRQREICANAKNLMATPVKLEINAIDGINSNFNDYRPVLSSDGQTMFFTSRRGHGLSGFEDGQYEEASYQSKLTDGKWSEPKLLENLIDEKDQQVTVTCLANNDKELYFISGGLIYMSLKDTATGGWLPADPISEAVNDYDSKIKYAYVTEDGNQLYFSSNRKGGHGGFDIYRSFRLPNGEWALPRNLGPDLNTPYDEDSPIMIGDDQILYFCSDGHSTMGGTDIFYAIENPDSTFSVVQNIGYPINTPDDDLFFMPTAKKDTAYYASIRWSKEPSTGYDIYRVIYDEPEVNTLVVMSGQIIADDLYDVGIVAESNGEQIGRFAPNRETGKFVIIAKAGGTYKVTVFSGDYQIERTITTTEKDCYLKSGFTLDIDKFDFEALAEAERAAEAERRAADALSNVYSAIDGEQDLYTVQFLSLRKKITPEETEVDLPENVSILEYADGWVVYTFGIYDNLRDANAALEKILKENKQYGDSFVRNLKHYKRYIKKE
ncbi:MAG: PD40 domain-containing protein [Bacteroidales bacterium]|nr:PD40 domain-containing protein [Bacteroidales bacterium]